MGHRVSLILLYDTDGEFLLQHRTEDAWILPGYWVLFGGGIKKGETPEDAVRREAFEELNYNLKILCLLQNRISMRELLMANVSYVTHQNL